MTKSFSNNKNKNNNKKGEVIEMVKDKEVTTEVSVIHEQEVLGKDFKVYGDLESPLFLAKSVAEWIDYGKKANGSYDVYTMLKTVDDDEKLMRTSSASGQRRNVWFLTEFGLYEVLMQSHKPLAKEFKKRVKVILKEIRLTGSYVVHQPQPQFKLPQTKIEALRALADQLEVNEQLEAEKAQLETVVATQTPMVEGFSVLTGDTDKLHTIKDIANNYGMSAIKFNELLHKLGVQYKQRGVWKLYAKYQGKGYTATPTGISPQGHTYKNMKWTNKGEYFLYNFLKERGYTSTVYEEMFESNLPTEP